MYIEAAISQGGRMRKAQVDYIVNNLHPSRCLTIFSPSGFGKSTVLKYISYNRKYRRRHRKLRNWLFIYIDCRDLAIAVDDYIRRIDHDQTVNSLEKIIEEKLCSAISRSKFCKNFHEFMSSEIRNSEVIIVLDNLEELTKNKYRIVLDYFRVLRDKYKPALEYIFAISSLNIVSNITRNKLGPISDLISQKVINLSAEDVTRDIYFDEFLVHRSFLGRLVIWLTKRHSAALKRISRQAGGYPQYAKILIQGYLDNIPESDLVDSKEMYVATNRLLDSLNKNAFEALLDIATKKIFSNRKIHYGGLLLDLGLVTDNNGVFKIKSPVLERHLKMYSRRNVPTS